MTIETPQRDKQVLKRLDSWVTGLLPENLKTADYDTVGRVKLTIWLSLALSLLATAYAAMYYFLLQCPNGALALVLTAALFTANPWIIRRTKSSVIGGNCVILVIQWAVLSTAHMSGGHSAPSVVWLPATSVFAICLIGVRWGIFWAAVTAVESIVLYVLTAVGYYSPPPFPVHYLRFVELTGALGVLASIFTCACFYEMVMRTSKRKLGEQSDHLQHQAQELKDINTSLQSEITRRQEAEEELIVSNHRLKVSNDQMSLLVKRLEEVNGELKDFVYIASHDLREPLRKISSFGQLLNDSLKDTLHGDDRENLDFMIDGAARMTEMIEGLLVYSRLNRAEKTFDAVDLNNTIEELKRLELAELLEETDGEIQVPEGLPDVKGESTQIRQLLQNLLANGIKYRRKDVPPRIAIRAQTTPDNMVRVEVRDNGIGIEEKHYQDVFTMFRRLHSKREYSGSGIGLAVCKKIVERYGGTIGVESTYGEGSTFWFMLSAVNEPIRTDAELQTV